MDFMVVCAPSIVYCAHYKLERLSMLLRSHPVDDVADFFRSTGREDEWSPFHTLDFDCITKRCCVGP